MHFKKCINSQTTQRQTLLYMQGNIKCGWLADNGQLIIGASLSVFAADKTENRGEIYLNITKLYSLAFQKSPP